MPLESSAVWESVYSRGEAFLQYPDNALVVASHRLGLAKSTRILDYGFGSGNNTAHLCQKGFEVSGIEVSASALTQARERLAVNGFSADLRLIEDVPFRDASFDCVIAWQVLYYNTLESLRSAMKEINRVLTPGGICLGTMCGEDDISRQHCRQISGEEYESTVPEQEGAPLVFLRDVPAFFSQYGSQIQIGMTDFEFSGRRSQHVIVSYVR